MVLLYLWVFTKFFMYVKSNLEQWMSTKSNTQALLGKVESLHESAIATSNSTFWGNIENIFFMILRCAHLCFLWVCSFICDSEALTVIKAIIHHKSVGQHITQHTHGFLEQENVAADNIRTHFPTNYNNKHKRFGDNYISVIAKCQLLHIQVSTAVVFQTSYGPYSRSTWQWVKNYWYSEFIEAADLAFREARTILI